MTTKIDFFIKCRKGGGFLARAPVPELEAQGNTLAELRLAIKRVVHAELGEDHAVCLRVGAVPLEQNARRASGAPESATLSES